MYATSEGLTTQKSSKTFRKIRIFLLKVRKIYAKYANFTEKIKNLAWIVQIFCKIYAKFLLRSYTEILSGQPLAFLYISNIDDSTHYTHVNIKFCYYLGYI